METCNYHKCENPREEGRKLCPTHIANHYVAQEKYKEKRRGTCTVCGGATSAKGVKVCAYCIQNEHRCIHCMGKKSPEDNRSIGSVSIIIKGVQGRKEEFCTVRAHRECGHAIYTGLARYLATTYGVKNSGELLNLEPIGGEDE